MKIVSQSAKKDIYDFQDIKIAEFRIKVYILSYKEIC